MVLEGILSRLSDYYRDTKFYGYEISKHAYELCQSKARQNVSFKTGNVFSDEHQKFEVAMAIDVFEHVEDYLEFLRKLNGLAKYKVYHIPLDLTLITILMPSRIKLRRKNSVIFITLRKRLLFAPFRIQDMKLSICSTLASRLIGIMPASRTRLLNLPGNAYIQLTRIWQHALLEDIP